MGEGASRNNPSPAALLLLSAAGVVIFSALSPFSHLMQRRWHESALRTER
jgi:NitT/TauT family transport system permease protein